MTERRHLIDVVNDIATKIIYPLIVAAVLSISAGAFATYLSVQRLTDKMQEHDAQIVQLQDDLKMLRESSVQRTELLEILKRVEQQLEIALLRSGIKVPPRILSGKGENQ